MSAKDDWLETEWISGGDQQGWVYRRDRAPAVPVGDAGYPNVAFLTVSFDRGERMGQPPAAEIEALAEFLDDAVEALSMEGVAIPVAEVLKPGMRELLFYTRSSREFGAIADVLALHFPQYRLVHAVFGDPLWLQYRELP
ncbi:MAG: DUF695 domain-containing protein [Steroidobacteraceae bacterium]|nr:DUF695 domain-containing protein [Steroidobacteraceae bacterium]